jgi:peptidoglycan lytic transglycosylase G
VTDLDPGIPPELDKRYSGVSYDYMVAPRLRFGGPLAILFVIAVFGGVFYAGYRVVGWGNDQLWPPGDPGTTEIAITLTEGDTASNISGRLTDAGVIVNENFYAWYVRLNGGVAFQAGEYVFYERQDVNEIMATLESGPSVVARAVTFPVQIPEGLTVNEIIARVDAADLPYTGATFAAALRTNRAQSRYVRSDQLPEGSEIYEGVLFPDTYAVQDGESAGLLVDRMIRRFDTIAASVELADAEARLGYSAYEVIIVASLIEREARIPEDRAKIARVIYNRLDAEPQGPLGIDATIVYALNGKTSLTAEDLEIDSPYNSRRNAGLPPTPIAAPGLASLEAAMNPADGDWFYYVLTDENGSHSFAVTDEEFQGYKLICQEKGLCG